jgi:NADH-quinone oxidoreductase subunit H
MSLPPLRRPAPTRTGFECDRAFVAGQFAAGVAVLVAAIAVASALPRLPWRLVDPALILIGSHPVINALVKALTVTVFVTIHVIFLIWLERKFAGWMQARLGPMHVGWKGALQTIADAVKLLMKEDIIPTRADRVLFVVAPFLTFMPTLLTFMVLPFSETWVAYDFPLGILFVLAVTTNISLGTLAAGWGANNKYSLLGGARACAQVLSYEIPMAVAMLAVVTLEGTMSLTEIVKNQQHGWNIIAHAPVMIPAFLIFMVCGLAELNRTPFDLPEAESELVSGFHTEYSGMRFAFFYLGEFAANFFTAGLAVTLFFGGWMGPWLPAPIWFGIKTIAVVALFMWIKWTVPRLRVDQMMGFCWKLLVPASVVVFCATALWVMVAQP